MHNLHIFKADETKKRVRKMGSEIYMVLNNITVITTQNSLQ